MSVDWEPSSVDWEFSSVDQESSSVDHWSTQKYFKSTGSNWRGMISDFKCQKASPTTLNGYILGEGYKRGPMLEFWSNQAWKAKTTIVIEKSTPSSQANHILSSIQRKKEEEGPLTPKDPKELPLHQQGFTPRRLKCPTHTNQSKESPSNQSSSSEISSKRGHLKSLMYYSLEYLYLC